LHKKEHTQLFHWLFRRSKKEAPVKEVSQPLPVSSPTWLDNRNRLDNTPYLLPKDALEDNRLDYQHYVLYLSIGSHYVAPLPPELHSILDVGTGTGIWAAEMARQYPQARIVGVDLATSSFKAELPANCTLQIGNILEQLPFPDQSFDYTHQRFLVSAILAARWPGVIHELVRVTRPGGWVELLEINNVFLNAGPETTRMAEWIAGVSQAMGFDADAVPSLGRWLTEEGLQLVETQDIVVPLGEWGGRAGSLLKRDLLSGFEAARAVYCARTNTPLDVFDSVLQTMAAEWETYHTSYTFHSVYGRLAEQ
jgi:SAM-dependent methyltransferase